MQQVRQAGRRWSASTVIVRVIAMTLIWMVLAEGELRYWGVVALAVIGGAVASLLLAPSSGLGLSLVAWLRFVPFFIWQSVLGGTDVALRAVAVPPRLDPDYVEFEFRLAEEPARVMVANTMSLMPGTLSVSLEGNRLTMHVLDRSMPAVERARLVETHVARMFRLTLPA